MTRRTLLALLFFALPAVTQTKVKVEVETKPAPAVAPRTEYRVVPVSGCDHPRTVLVPVSRAPVVVVAPVPRYYVVPAVYAAPASVVVVERRRRWTPVRDAVDAVRAFWGCP